MSCLLFDFAIEPLAAAFRSSTLRGFPIPGHHERLVAKLFADDTTVFLSEDDSYTDVEALTSTWCAGSRAKFNLHKTEVIPIGTPEFRARLTRTRQLTASSTPIPSSVHLVRDGEAIRLLGAWIGNHVDPQQSWQPIVDTVRVNLAKWARRRPTLYGKKLVIGMELGGRTQFRTKAQGMPASVAASLTAALRTFMWGDSNAPPVALRTLYSDVSQGGLALLDLDARNEAIDMMWLKAYLALSHDRP
ncbi:hypothetical protein C8Q70DRAFT_925301, partial [Cubamyces menziesii]